MTLAIYIFLQLYNAHNLPTYAANRAQEADNCAQEPNATIIMKIMNKSCGKTLNKRLIYFNVLIIFI